MAQWSWGGDTTEHGDSVWGHKEWENSIWHLTSPVKLNSEPRVTKHMGNGQNRKSRQFPLIDGSVKYFLKPSQAQASRAVLQRKQQCLKYLKTATNHTGLPLSQVPVSQHPLETQCLWSLKVCGQLRFFCLHYLPVTYDPTESLAKQVRNLIHTPQAPEEQLACPWSF